MANFLVTNYAELVAAINTANGTPANDSIYLQNDIQLTAAQALNLQTPEGSGTLRIRGGTPANNATTPATPANPINYTLGVQTDLVISDNTPTTAQPSFTIGPLTLQIGDGGTGGSLTGNLRGDDDGVIAFNRSANTTYTGTFSLEEENTVRNDVAGTTVTFNGLAGTNGLAIRASQGTGAASGYELTLDGPGNGVISGIIGDSGIVNAGTAETQGDIEKEGDGTWTFSGNNTYVGVTTVSEGTLNVQSATGLGSAGNGTIIEDGATLALGSVNGITIASEALTLEGDGVAEDDPAASGVGALQNVSGNNTFGGAITLGTILPGNTTDTDPTNDEDVTTAASGRINSDDGTLTLTGGIDGAEAVGDASAVAILTLGGDGDGVVNSAIGGNVTGLVKDGDGTWTLAQANAYVGGTSLDAGTLELGNLAAAGAEEITFGDGAQTLRLDVTGTLGNEIDDFGAGDIIDLDEIERNGAILTTSSSGGVTTLTVANGADSNTLTLENVAAGSRYALGTDDDGSATIIVEGIPNPPPPPVAEPTSSSDNLTGTEDADTVRLLAGADSYSGLGGNDLIYGNQGNDTLYGNQGNDTVYGGQDNDRAYGGQGDDRLYGNKGNDQLYGGQGNDYLVGGDGADTLVGGLGNDILIGGAGADRYLFAPDPGAVDLIRGFSQGEGDRLDLGGQDYTVRYAGDGDAILTLSGGSQVRLDGVTQQEFGNGAGYIVG